MKNPNQLDLGNWRKRKSFDQDVRIIEGYIMKKNDY